MNGVIKPSQWDGYVTKFVQAYPDGKVATGSPGSYLKSDYRVVYFVGGLGAMWDFPREKHLAELVQTSYEHGAMLASICHGAAAFLGVKKYHGGNLLKGVRVTAFSNEEERIRGVADKLPFLLEDELRKEGAIVENKSDRDVNVLHDNGILTAQNPTSLGALSDGLYQGLVANERENNG